MGVAPNVTVGSSFTDVTVIVLVISPALKDVVPPLLEVLMVSPAERPAVLSHARYLMVAVPKKSRLGTKRILWLGLAILQMRILLFLVSQFQY